MTVVSAPDREHAGLLQAPTDPTLLAPGMLLFFSRPSALQTWAEMFGHEWRHVGVTVQTSEGLRVASYAPNGCFRLDDPMDLLANYDRIGVAVLFNSEVEVRRVESFCRRFLHFERSDSPYAYSAIAVGPIHLAARRRKRGLLRRLMFIVVKVYCRLQDVRYQDRTAFACSTFVWAAIDHAREQPLRIPLCAHPDDGAAYASPSTSEEDLYARWLCGPTELWQAISPQSRSELELRLPEPDDEQRAIVQEVWNHEVATSENRESTMVSL